MKIMNIIKEASSPTKKRLYMVTEAEEDTNTPQQSTNEDPPQQTQNQEETETEEEEVEETETTTEEEPTDDEEETDLDDEGNLDDDSSYDSDSGDSYETDDDSGQSVDDTPEEKKNRAIFNDSIFLYNSIKDTISRLQDLNHSNIITNRIVLQVKKNLGDMLDLLYRFITEKHELQTYQQNLYTYNYFIEAYKINAKMIEKMSGLSNTQ